MINEELVSELTLIKEQTKINAEDIKEIKKRQDDMDKLVTTVAVMANTQERMGDDITEIKSDVKALTDKPGKRWDRVVDKIVAAIVGAFLLWLATGMPGLK